MDIKIWAAHPDSGYELVVEPISSRRRQARWKLLVREDGSATIEGGKNLIELPSNQSRDANNCNHETERNDKPQFKSPNYTCKKCGKDFRRIK